MKPFAHPLPIALAVAGLLLATQGAQAASGEAVEHVNVVGHLALRDACPAVDMRELADELIPAWEDAVKPSSVEVDFMLERRHVYGVLPATDSPRLYHQIRRAVHGLHCDAGDDRSHAVRFVVRFVDGDDGTRLATIVPARADDAPAR
jgi:hypothetical protein